MYTSVICENGNPYENSHSCDYFKEIYRNDVYNVYKIIE